ncbi:hypothetical protein EJ357_26110 [Streptomyces cyaneochromogenes]|uniref:Secreted protein n=1 Tax=Streptomyces cyaneochromogenes TaxID=2496836 RepID=A0A3Q9EVJ2_9ACTN|nr:hypothetical protein [Streptomyces cyaneochromogenes]AZQ36490.1 hypothetical protein EJ357_26110 [Streptomyces cyaneochromogenes]
MPRGRHRHSPPLHRLLPPSAIAGVSVVCALAPWVFTEPLVLRGLAGAAAATAVIGAVVMRRWDTQAGKKVADLTRARASDEWRYEERVAELETDLEESRELRMKLEQRLRGKRAELAGLRNEHAALLRRYATAETERASVLEERRVLEIEATAPARALPPAPVDASSAQETGAVAAPAEAEAEGAETESAESVESNEETPVTPAVFSPEGSRLFLRAKAALARFDGEEAAEDGESVQVSESALDTEPVQVSESARDTEPVQVAESAKGSESAKDQSPKDEPPNNEPPKGDGRSNGESAKDGSGATGAQTAAARTTEAQHVGGSEKEPALEDEAQGKPEAVDGHQRAAANTTADALTRTDARIGTGAVAETDAVAKAATVATTDAPAVARPALPPAGSIPSQQPAGHFIAPTAVAVVPATPVRRPMIEGGFDFFGTKRGAAMPSALESVQNEDLADVVGQEALALHKAESEAEFKPADEESRGIGQVIDLTAHDETEQIDVQGLRSAVS